MQRNLVRGFCWMHGSSEAHGAQVSVCANFPNGYPYGVPPTFAVSSPQLDEEQCSRLSRVGGQRDVARHAGDETQNLKLSRPFVSILVTAQLLTGIALPFVQRGQGCLEACLRQLNVLLDQVITSSDDAAQPDGARTVPRQSDFSVPLPRTCVGVFGGPGKVQSRKYPLPVSCCCLRDFRSLLWLPSVDILVLLRRDAGTRPGNYSSARSLGESARPFAGNRLTASINTGPRVPEVRVVSLAGLLLPMATLASRYR